MDSSLINFFKEEIFDLDDDEIEIFLDKYPADKIQSCIDRRLEFAENLDKSSAYDDSWRLGRILGAYEKAKIDQYIIPKIDNSDLIMKEVYFNFLAGYWDEAEANLDSAKSLIKFIATALSSGDWTQDLAAVSIEPVAVVYGNSKAELMQDTGFMDSLNIIT